MLELRPHTAATETCVSASSCASFRHVGLDTIPLAIADSLISQITQLAIDISHELITISSLLDSSRQPLRRSSRPSQPFQSTPLGRTRVLFKFSEVCGCLDFWNPHARSANCVVSAVSSMT